MAKRSPATNALRKLHRADRRASETAAEARHYPIVEALGLTSEAADQPPLFLVSAAAIAGGLLLRRPQLMRRGARMLAAQALATAIKSVVKRQVDRSRPTKAIADDYMLKKGDSQAHDLSSFPSGHTAGAVAVASAVAHDQPAAAPVAALAAGAVAATQPATGKHYISDVIAGAVIGWVAERIAGALIDRIMPAPPSARRRGRSAPR